MKIKLTKKDLLKRKQNSTITEIKLSDIKHSVLTLDEICKVDSVILEDYNTGVSVILKERIKD